MKKIRLFLSMSMLLLSCMLVSAQPIDKKYKGFFFSKFSVSYGLTMFNQNQDLKDYNDYIGAENEKPLNVLAAEYDIAWRLGHQSNWSLAFGFRFGFGFSSDSYSKKLSDSPYGQELNSQLSDLKKLYNQYVAAGYKGTQLSTVKSQIDYVDKLLNTKFNFNSKRRMFTIVVPVNLGYQIRLSEKIGLSPYAGINLKVNAFAKSKDVATYSNGSVFKDLSDTDWDIIDDISICQFGWQLGLSLTIKKFFFGLEYGTDFTPFQKVELSQYKEGKINTQNLVISTGVYF